MPDGGDALPRTTKEHDAVFAKNVVLFSGHGVECRKYVDPVNATTELPAGTTLTFWTGGEDKSGLKVNLLADATGKLIETDLAKVVSKVQDIPSTEPNGNEYNLPVTYDPGEFVPNYVLMTPTNLTLGKPLPGTKMVTVGGGGFSGRFLHELLAQFSGHNCHWVACREKQGDKVSTHITPGPVTTVP